MGYSREEYAGKPVIAILNTWNRIKAGAKWLRENYKRSISITQAAEGAGMSERTFLRRFKAETSVTPSEYLLGIRLEAVCRLLIETSLPVDKIARRCGMGGGERLSRVFRRRFSSTPTKYRAAHSGASGAEHFVLRHLAANFKFEVPTLFKYQPTIACWHAS
ncbi:helix-turn-helix domain-containing protein [Trinickia terrae]|uniref:Helix-turn-helix domain-containing protein n=2 Tax=Trinickia terrae TaxID=2571161 RepID=A0A4U1IG32_9BURK|nr:helix-turn-helix domain-containing protein [Trinickia terrae]